MATLRVKVSPELLTWAVERVGQNVEEYALQNENFKELDLTQKLNKYTNENHTARD